MGWKQHNKIHKISAEGKEIVSNSSTISINIQRWLRIAYSVSFLYSFSNIQFSRKRNFLLTSYLHLSTFNQQSGVYHSVLRCENLNKKTKYTTMLHKFISIFHNIKQYFTTEQHNQTTHITNQHVTIHFPQVILYYYLLLYIIISKSVFQS